MKKITFLGIVLFSIISNSQSLDSTFGPNGGIVTNQITANPSATGDTATGAALQADGKVVIVATNKVLRINTDGTLDNSFNSYGSTNIGSQLEAIKIQPDGKILVAGLNSVYRINTDGSVDASFGNNGSVIIQINNFDMRIKSIGLRSDTKIILGGFVSNGTNNDFAVSCLNTDGSFDSLFDSDGKATLDINNQNNEGIELAIQNDDKIVLTGQWFDGTIYNFATSRFNTDGSLDTTFGINGYVTTTLGSSSKAQSVDIQNDGTILVSGVYLSNKLAVVRYTSTGILDITFNTTGKLLTTKSYSVLTSLLSNQSKKPHIKCLSNGKILVSGTNFYSFSIHQINNDGSFDSSFGTNGSSTYTINSYDCSSFLLISLDGKIITGGISSIASIPRIEKLQFSSDGIFESEQNYNIVYGTDSIFDIVEQSTGKTIISNGTDIYTKNALIRYNIDGSIDTTFGTNGILSPTSSFSAFVKQPDDKLLTNDVNSGQSITRYTSDGILDTTFGVGGVVDFSSITPLIVSFIDNITVSQNGKINVAFDYSTTGVQCSQTHFGALRLNADGSIDTTFGTNGYTDIPFDLYSTDESEFPQSIYEEADGKLIITGTISNSSNTIGQVGTTRINSDGTIDTTFGTNGTVVTLTGTFGDGLSIMKTPNNKYLINSYDARSPTYTSLIQYNYDGSIDTTFGTNGILSDHQHYFSVILQPDGKILSGGTTNNQFAIYRSNSDSSLDTTFGTNGVLITPVLYSSNINKLLNLQNGKILAGGYAFNGTNQVFAQARYTFDNLGITNNANINSFKIYPNPANNQFTIDLGNEIKSVNYQVKILNLLGQEVHHSFEKTIITTIPVTWTGKGLYSVNIYDEQDNLLKTEKIIVE